MVAVLKAKPGSEAVRWRSQDDLDAHMQTAHIAHALQTAGEAIDGGPAIHPLTPVGD